MFCFNTQPYDYKYTLPSTSVPNGIPHNTTSDLMNKAISTPLHLRKQSMERIEINRRAVLSPISFTPPLMQEDLTDHNHEAIAAKKKQFQEKQLQHTSHHTPRSATTDRSGEPIKFERVNVGTNAERSLLSTDLRPSNISPTVKRPPLKAAQISPRSVGQNYTYFLT
jgi:hypothetical protein